ncbi:MAG: dihydroorotase [Polyangiaceae bacterium]|nr:dihydroorotase [Polyangiaceae bacterium]
MDPARGLDQSCDVVIDHGLIVRVGVGAARDVAAAPNARIINAQGLWLLPAFVDLHAHLREPGHEYKEDIASGLAAAAAGGYAHVCAMPNTSPVNDTRAVTEMMRRRAQEAGAAALHPIAAITRGLRGEHLTEMAELREAGAVAVSDDGHCVQSSAVMRRALEYASNFGMPVMQHAEAHELTVGAEMHEGAVSARLGLRGWPRVAEDIIVGRDLLLAEYVGARYHVLHVSTRGALQLIRQAKDRGVQVSCEATPHHLLLTDEALVGYDTSCRVNPPLRESADMLALREALLDGTVDAVATDHAPHSSLEKDCEFSQAAPGVIGLELTAALLVPVFGAQAAGLHRLIDALSTRPAKIIGIAPPAIAEGSIAELTLFDPNERWRPAETGLRSKSRNTPFLNAELKGRVRMTWAQGRLVHDALAGSAGVGGSGDGTAVVGGRA